MNADDLKKRTKQFALRVPKLVAALPKTVSGRAIAGQLARAGTSVGANYRAACRGRSLAEFIAKMGTTEEEADESLGWLELIGALEMASGLEFDWLLREADELTAIFSASHKTAQANRQRRG